MSDRTIHRENFAYELGSTVEARQGDTGAWRATIGKSVAVDAPTPEQAIWNAKAAYLRDAADRIEKTGEL